MNQNMDMVMVKNEENHLATPLYLDTPLEKPLLFLQQEKS